MRRLVSLISVLVLATALPASAKIPPFILTVDPDPPVAGETTTIAAEFESSFPVDQLSGLLILYKASDGLEPGGKIAIALERVGSTRYEATVVIPEAGTWVLKAFPNRDGWSTPEVPPGYPDVIELEVLAHADTASTPDSNPVGIVQLAAVVVALLSIGGLRYLLGQGRPTVVPDQR